MGYGAGRVSAPGLHLSGSARFGATPLFAPLELTAAPGEWTCLLGPSGVGKSTILRLFAGLADVVEFDGAVRADDGVPLNGRIALMAQSDLLMPWLSALDNVLIGARLRGERADPDQGRAVLEQVGLGPHIAKKPAALSGGQRQRVALARTLLEDRPIVLLDEPFSALDARTRSQMQELAVETLEGRTVLLVTHEPAEAARLGHRILVMSETGLDDFTPPPGETPRPLDDPATLAAQGRLLARLRAEDVA